MRAQAKTHDQKDVSKEQQQDNHRGMYLRFLAMIATSTVVMYALTYANTYEYDHARWSETRLFMALLMGGAMALIMLGFMTNMLKDSKRNALIVFGALSLMVVAIILVRSQVTVEDRSYMSAMIPHHSIAILTSENSEIQDVRVCELAVKIAEAQRREIREMKWLIEDIGEKGPATTSAAAEQRPVPSFEGGSFRDCS